LPSQLVAGVSAPDTQLAPRQPTLVDHGLHAPSPLQVPSCEQSPAAASLATQRPLGSVPPAGTGRQLPTFPGTLQVRQIPAVASSLHAVSQHTPSVQWPLAHWELAEHAVPGGFRPQELLTQVLGATQSASVVQVDLQAATLQTKVPQEELLGVTQFPAPSHVEAGVCSEAEEHTAGLQFLPLSYWAQAPALHNPVVPHVDCAVTKH